MSTQEPDCPHGYSLGLFWCVCVGVLVEVRGQNVRVSSPNMGPGIELRLLSLVASNLTH